MLKNHLGSFLALLVSLCCFTSVAAAADPNGYTAQYECRAGGQVCNVDVAALGNRACDQIVTTSTPWSSINWSQNTICIEAGDHTGKGNLTVPSSASGAPGSYKVLRYYRANDTGDDPWRLSSGDQARLRELVLDGANYWLVHRLTFPKNTGSPARVSMQNGASNLILNRLLVEGEDSIPMDGGIIASPCFSGTGNNVTVQNTVIRDNPGKVGADPMGLALECGSDIHLVNNEIYNFSSHNIQMGSNSGPLLAGLVVENNDLYLTSDMYTTNGTLMSAKNPLTIKAGGVASNPIRILHNRIWGSRFSDTNVCCITGAPGAGMSNTPPQSGGFSYVLWRNNIVMDSQQGMTWPVGSNAHQSVVGNIFYKLRQYYSGWNSYAIEFINNSNSEIYLNSIIDAASHFMYIGRDASNDDVRCNAIFASGDRDVQHVGELPGAGTVMDNNAFYGTTPYTFGGADNNITRALRQRLGSTDYDVGEMLALGGTDDCGKTSDAACYIYQVTQAGTTAAGAAQYCTSLGCTIADGSVVLRAIRGPFSFYRKLQTGPEVSIIPYARVHTSAPEARKCPADFSARAGIGISDD